MSPTTAKQLRLRLTLGGVLVTLLLAAVFTLGSLDVPLEPKSWREVIALWAVSSLIIMRNIVRLLVERSKEQLGARFKTKMVMGAVAVSLLPVIFMFFISYALLNRTLGRWFPRPLEIASEETQKLLNDLGHGALPRLHTLGYQAAQRVGETPEVFLQHAFTVGLDAVWVFDSKGKFVKGGVLCDDQQEDRTLNIC